MSGMSTDVQDRTTIALERAEWLELRRLQMAALEQEGLKLTLTQIVRRALDALAEAGDQYRKAVTAGEGKTT
jgi:hypothetical protein